MTHDAGRRLHPVEPPNDPTHDHDYGPRPDTTPADHAAEQAVLTALLTPPTPDGHHPHTDLDTILTTTDFYWPVHQTIWNTWHQLHTTHGTPPDAVTLNAAIVATRDTPTIRVIADLTTNLATGNTNPHLATAHAHIVRDHARLRVAHDIGTGLIQIARTGKTGNIDHYLGEALQRLDDAAMRFGQDPTPEPTGLRDLTWILQGDPPTQPPPTWGQRTDGTALFYAGKVNGVFGDPEHGKTWLAQIAAVEALNAGHTAAMIDVDHNGPDHTAARLLLLGARLDHIADPNRFRYYEPEDGTELLAAVDDITHLTPAIVIIDSLGEIFPMLGVKTNDSDEMTTAMRRVCTRPATAGSCVITIDHLPKSADARATGFAIGSIAKKRMIRGSYIRAEARQQPAPGAIGRITLRIEKDTAGELRKTSGGGYAGTLTLDSTQNHTTTWTIGRDETPKNDDGTFRPTLLMERISRYIEDNDQCTFTDIKENVQGKDKWLRDAIQVLVTEGHIARIDGARRAKLHHSTAPYRTTEDDHVPDSH